MAVDQVVDNHGSRFWLLSIPGDGNCLIGSVVHQIYGITPAHHLFELYKLQLREASVDEIIDHLEYYTEQLVVFAEDAIADDIPVTDKVQRYLEQLRADGTWVGADCIAAICNLHQIAITIHQDNGKVEFTPTRSETAEWPVYRIFYKDLVDGVRTHYDSVLCFRLAELPPFQFIDLEADKVMLSNSTTVADVVRIGDANQSVFTALHHQLTRRIPTEEELNIYRGLIASELENQTSLFLSSLGISSEQDFETFLLRLRIGRHDGGLATLSLMSSLFGFKIYVHSASNVTNLIEPIGIKQSVALHIFEEEANDRSVYASIVHLEHLRSSEHSQMRRRLLPDPMAVATKVARDQSASQATIEAEALVLPARGMRVASLNVNGCRAKRKRDDIDAYLVSRLVHVAALQEVNLDCLQCMTSNYQWHMGETSGSRKRGLAILVRRGLDVQLLASKDKGANVQYLKVAYQV